MNQKTFKKIIEQELKKLDRKQAVHFAWLCAVRALPLLGGNGNFDFWNKKDRQKHLYAIFYALDVNAFSFATAASSSAAASSAAADAASTDASSAASSSAAFASAAAVAFAATASVASSITADAAAYTAATSVVADATAYTSSAAFSAALYASTAAIKKHMNLNNIILFDLKTIQNGEKWQNIHTDLYGSVWNEFQKALEAEGCSYWGKLYKSIFDNEFVLDKKALKRRINVPKEIREQGATAVANYLEESEKGAKRLNEARIIILGDKGAGKTCLARRLINPKAPMTTDNESTAGVDIKLWKLEKENINVHIWDFAGHTVTHAVHQFFLSERCLYVVVCNGRNEDSDKLKYWLNHMKNYGGDSKAIILVNKRDQHRVDIPINSLKEQYPIENIYSFSVQDDKLELKAFRNDVAKYIKNNPSWNKLEIPANYYRVKEALEELFINGKKGDGKEHITKEKFDSIARKNGVDNIEILLTDLHALGVSLWYKDMEEFDTLVLNPEWISQGVYKIINWVNEEKKYSLTLDDFATVFKDVENRYSTDKFKFLFELMKHYELAYETKEGKCLIIPHLLKEDRPDSLPDFSVGESLMLRYKAEQPLPPNTISRFIVRHNQQIKKTGDTYLVWRYGVILDDDNGNNALVREEDRTISVSVKGRDKTSYLSELRQTLNDIFNSYKSDKPELQYRIERFGQIPDEIEAKKPLWLPDNKILTHAIDNMPYYDDNTRREIDLHYTVNNYNITAQTLINGQNQFTDKSIHSTFNFYDCNIGLQGNLNELAQLLTEGGKEEEAKELENVAKALEQAEKCKTKEEVRKKGIINRLKRLAENLSDENSMLHKTVKGINNGMSIANEIIKAYSSIAGWTG